MNPTGYIEPSQRTIQQANAHDEAMTGIKTLVHYGLPMPAMAAGDKVRLFDLWNHPTILRGTKNKPFKRKWQKTGSCVDAGGFAALCSSIAGQAVAKSNTIEAFLPFTWHNYAMSRHYMGDDRQGEGSLGSTFAKSLTFDGVRDWPQDRTDVLPDYAEEDDAYGITSSQEMAWSSYRNPNIAPMLVLTKQHLIGSAAECKTVEDIRAAVLNGYGVTFACNNFIGNARIEGSGADACVIGYWDGRGGHQQSIHGVWEHPSLGPLYWAQNNWPGSTYPKDPAGGPTCGCWVREQKVKDALRLDSEVYALSAINWLPTKPEIMEVTSWLI